MAEDANELRRSSRLALSEVSCNENDHETPSKTASPDEIIIVHRGPRKKPITWSPVDATKLEAQSPDGPQPRRPLLRSDLNPKLRRRLILSPSKNSSSLGNLIAKKLKSLPKFDRSFISN